VLLAAQPGAGKTSTAVPSTVPVTEQPVEPATASEATEAPVIELTKDGSGLVAIIGGATSANFVISAELFPNPTVVLYNFSNYIKGQRDAFVSELGQIQGIFTEPLFPLPGEFRINLPIQPTGASVDLDNNGAEDKGVQVYQLAVAANYNGNSYLQQVEQLDSGKAAVGIGRVSLAR
jgi:hypothetical protein